MREACKLTYLTLKAVEPYIRPGMTTAELDDVAREFILSHGAKPSFLHLYGFPASMCISIDDEVVHGIPSRKRVLEEGQIISLDVGAQLNGFHGDCARTYPVGKIDREKERLIRVTEESFWQGVSVIRPGVNLREVSRAIQNHVEARGFSVVRDLTGHGIGKKVHEDPSIPNYDNGVGVILAEGMTLAIEPMVAAGDYALNMQGWHITTRDHLPSAHYENTILVTATGYEVLTASEVTDAG